MRVPMLILVLWTHLLAAAPDPHRIEGMTPAPWCADCHLTQPPPPGPGSRFTLPKAAGLRKGGMEMCAPCHDTGLGHKVGMRVEFAVPADLPLEAGNTLTCLTCHHVHGPLRSDRPWASVSLLDRLFDPERLHKTYLLRRNNSDGALCLVCHSKEETTP